VRCPSHYFGLAPPQVYEPQVYGWVTDMGTERVLADQLRLRGLLLDCDGTWGGPTSPD